MNNLFTKLNYIMKYYILYQYNFIKKTKKIVLQIFLYYSI